MPDIGIPPWIKPADEAQHLAQGYGIGIAIGTRQAEQQFRQQQELRQQEEEAQAKARWEAEFNMKAQESSRRLQAQMDYQNAVQGGMEPLDAILRYGPAMGHQSSAEAAALRAQMQEQKLKDQQPLSYAPFAMGDVKGIMRSDMKHFIPSPETGGTPGPLQSFPVMGPDQQPIPGTFAVPSAGGKGMTVHQNPQLEGRLTQVDRDDLHQLERDQDRVEKEIDKNEDPLGIVGMLMQKDPKTLNDMQKNILTQHAAKKSQVQALQVQIDSIKARARGTSQTAAPAAKDKVARANQLAAQHPGWTRQQVIAAVKQEFANAATSAP